MNFAHIHLILNHIPVIGIPIALVFLIHGFLAKNSSSQRFALFVLVALAVVALPVYFTGDPAEKVVKHLPEVSKSFIEPHEDAAQISLTLTLALGFEALVALFFQKDEKKARLLNFTVMILAAIATLSLLYTANLGGKIRHTELRSDSTVQTP